MITLKSSDNQKFEVEEAVGMQSEVIKNMIEDGCADSDIPVPNVTGKILAMVIEYSKKHTEEAAMENEGSLKSFDEEFVKVDTDTLYDLILAANYLNVKSLLDLCCQAVADKIKGKSPEEIRKEFRIENDFNPEEEAEIRSENAWAY